MWFGKNKLNRFVMVLAMAVSAISSAWAATDIRDSLYPLYFENITTGDAPKAEREAQQKEWNYLMKFKMFGATGIEFGNKDIKIPDTTGWFGTATGDFKWGQNGGSKVGGPILIGGSMIFEQGPDTIMTGPTRINGGVTVNSPVNYSQKPNSMGGESCVNGTAASQYLAFVAESNRHNFSNCSKDVPEVKTDLKTPAFYYDGHSINPALTINGAGCVGTKTADGTCVVYIDVPEGDYETPYDYYIESIKMENGAKLVFRMQPGGRLARVFFRDDLSLTPRSKIQVMYMDKGATYSGGSWSGSGSIVANDKYAGNLLFYTQQDIKFPTFNQGTDTLQGTFISQKTITVGQHTILAGQLLANKIVVDTDFDGSGFIYKPFNAATLNVADGGDTFVEGAHEYEEIQIDLDRPAETNISFEYCFEFETTEVGGTADKDTLASEDDIDLDKDPDFPICGKKPNRSASYKIGATKLTSPIKIYIKDDKILENSKKGERITLRVMNLAGARLKNDTKNEETKLGYLYLYIRDNDGLLTSENGTSIDVTEDTKFTFTKDVFPVYDVDGDPWDDDFGIFIVTPPKKDSLKTRVNSGADEGLEEAVDYKRKIGGKYVGVPKGILDGSMGWNLVYNPPANAYGTKYDSLEFKVLRDGLESEKSYWLYINIIPVNDPPTAHDTLYTINENVDTKAGAVMATGSIRVEDDDDKVFTYSWSEKYEGKYTEAMHDRILELYELDEATGKISAKKGAVLNRETTDSLLIARIVVSDGNGGTGDDDKILRDTITATIRIIDVNDKPVIVPDQVFEVSENAGKDAGVSKNVVAVDSVDRKANNRNLNKVLADDEDLDKSKPKGWGYLTYTISDPSGNFVIGTESGVISVKDGADIDFEDDTKKTFTVTVYVADGGGLKDTATVIINITDDNDIPELVDVKDQYDVDEHVSNGTVVALVEIKDPDASDASATDFIAELKDNNIACGAVCAQDLFEASVVEDGGKLYYQVAVKDSALVNYEDLLYKSFDVTFTLKDGESSVTATTKIVVNDINEQHDVKEQTKFVKENLPKDTPVDTLDIYDPDTSAAFTKYTISIVNDTVPFVLDPSNNKIILVKAGAKLNYEKDSVYTVIVAVTDKDFQDTAAITIKLTDEKEPPEIIIPDPDDPKCVDAMLVKCDDPFIPPPTTCTENCGSLNPVDTSVVLYVKEHSAKGTKVLEYYVEDEDAGDLASMTVSISNSPNTGFGKIFDYTTTLVKEGDRYKFVVTVKDSDKLDFETSSHEHKITITVSDEAGLTDTIVRTIKVTDINEPHELEEKVIRTVEENLPKGTAVDTLKVVDADTALVFRTYNYAILETGVPFALDSKDPRIIVVSDPSKLNYEKVKSFTFHVRAYDSDFADTVEVVINLSNKNEPPEIIIPDPDNPKCDAMLVKCDDPFIPPPTTCTENCGSLNPVDSSVVLYVKENSATGTQVMEYYVEDEDFGDLSTITVSIKDLNKSGFDTLFNYSTKLIKEGDKYKFVVTVADSSKLDYETTAHEHKIAITVKDAGGLTDSIIRTIKIVDVNEAPFLEKDVFDVDEHLSAGTVVDIIKWGDDKDSAGVSNPLFRDNEVTLIGGDTDKFEVDAKGVITTKQEFNYETDDHSYILIVKVADKNEPSLSVVDTMKINLVNVPEPPEFTETEFEVTEHVAKNTVIDTLTSSDPDCLGAATCKLTYQLLDPTKYVTISSDGIIKVADSTLIDYEKIENIKLKVRVIDADGLTADTVITIKVKDINERPSVKDETVIVPEDTKVGTPIDTVKASDPDKDPKNGTLTYSIVSGDTSVFTINSKTGVITLKGPLDYEAVDKYKLKVEVTDGQYKETAEITVKVKDVDERSKVDIYEVVTSDTTYSNPDIIYINESKVNFCWRNGRAVDTVAVWADSTCKDTTLTPGRNVIKRKYKDPTTNTEAKDSVVIYYSNTEPTVNIYAKGDAAKTHNIYTIVEQPDDKDSTIYVNHESNDIVISVHDPVAEMAGGNKKSVDTLIVISLELGTVKVDSKTYTNIGNVVNETVALNPNPKKETVTRKTNADGSVNVSYTEKVAGITVTVSYVEDENGDVVKVPVTRSNGNIDSIEVITVSYKTKDQSGKEITVSYTADAVTGKALMTDAQGNLMTSGAANNANSSGKYTTAGIYNITYRPTMDTKDTVVVSYTVDSKGKLITNSRGESGYNVAYTYTDACNNSKTANVFIVIDKVMPEVVILYPANKDVIYSSFTEVVWTVDGEKQDTLTTQGLQPGANPIVRFYRDKAGNEASDTVYVIMKDSKNVVLSVEKPVTEMSKEKVDEYYSKNPLSEGQTYAVTVQVPRTGKEVETIKGGSFGTKKGSGKEPYPGLDEDEGHLGPTLVMEVKLPVISGKDGLATLDDILSKDGLYVLKEGIDATTGDIKGIDSLTGEVSDDGKILIADYIREHCTDEVQNSYRAGDDLSQFNLYDTKVGIKIWIYTTIGGFVDYYSFTQEMNNPDYTNESGMAKMFFELKPDKNGNVRSEDGRLMATGAYLYKVEATVRSKARCDIPSLSNSKGRKKNDVVKNDDELLKNFGYRRPAVK